jgi:hypothetical protein
MEIFGGFMVMLSILGFFLAVLWFILPFVIFAMKGKQDRAVELLEQIERRLLVIEARLGGVSSPAPPAKPAPLTSEPGSPPSAEPPPSVVE